MELDPYILKAQRDPRFEPRFHAAIGMIQMFLHKDQRLHVWHPELKATRPDSNIHNHRFSFESEVLQGKLYHEVIGPLPGSNWCMWQSHQDPGPKAELIGTVNISILASIELVHGDAYHFEAGRFHRSKVEGLTITRMRKTWTNPAQPVFVLAKPGVTLDHAFSPALERPSTARLWELLNDALKDQP